MKVHSVLPASLTRAVDAVVVEAGIEHVQHEQEHPVDAAVEAAGDPAALALIGPFRSRDVAEAVEVTAPVGLPLLAPVATWAGVTRDDEPGCDDPARQAGTTFRLLARDTVVAARLAAHLRAVAARALVVSGGHEYGRQLEGQLRLAGLERAEDVGEADVVVFAGLAGEPEVQRAEALAPLPIVAFDGIQGADLGEDREVLLVLPFEPVAGVRSGDLFAGVEHARRAADLVVAAVRRGATDRGSVLADLRASERFDDHGDPVDPPVWLWGAQPDRSLTPDRAI